jgi:hypothetical protein
MLMKRTILLLGLQLAFVIVASSDCGVHRRPVVVYGYAAYYADAVPDDLDAYPHVYYEGRYAYLVGTRWFYAGPRGWVIFREEPPPLVQFRARLTLAPNASPEAPPPPPYVREVPPEPTNRRTRNMRRDVLPSPATPP